MKAMVDEISAFIRQNILSGSKVGEIPKTSVLRMEAWALRPGVLTEAAGVCLGH
jgi:hypothetical protein